MQIRLATMADLPALHAVMAAAIDALQPDLDATQRTASRAIMGLDTQLITDGTYCVALRDNAIAGCGGWSRRATAYGGDHSTAQRDAALLNPAHDAARVRAMYTSPAFARQGVGRAVLAWCENAAAAAGFGHAMLMATLAGVPLYRAAGWQAIAPITDCTTPGVPLVLWRMEKLL
jgi:GNAT superfamily N-acetyltransferase